MVAPAGVRATSHCPAGVYLQAFRSLYLASSQSCMQSVIMATDGSWTRLWKSNETGGTLDPLLGEAVRAGQLCAACAPPWPLVVDFRSPAAWVREGSPTPRQNPRFSSRQRGSYLWPHPAPWFLWRETCTRDCLDGLGLSHCLSPLEEKFQWDTITSVCPPSSHCMQQKSSVFVWPGWKYL